MKIGDKLELKKDYPLKDGTVWKKGEEAIIIDIAETSNNQPLYKFENNKRNRFLLEYEIKEIFITRKDKIDSLNL